MREINIESQARAGYIADSVLVQKVDAALQNTKLLPRTDYEHIAIKSKAGVVTLRGHVGTKANKKRAEHAAACVPGVVQMENQLCADDELAMEVAHALGYDAHMQGEQMGVNAQHGVVYLTGSASSAAIRLLAAQIAAGVSQVRGIINRIQAPGVVMDVDEEHFMQPLVQHEIYAASGQLGRVQQVIIDPQNRRVTTVVVHAEMPVRQMVDQARLPTEKLQTHHPILIPIHSLRCAPSGALFLDVKNDDVHFAAFNPLSFGIPPADWQPPYPYRAADVLFDRYRS